MIFAEDIAVDQSNSDDTFCGGAPRRTRLLDTPPHRCPPPAQEDSGSDIPGDPVIALKDFGKQPLWKISGTPSDWQYFRPHRPRRHSKQNPAPEGIIYMEILQCLVFRNLDAIHC